MSQNSERDAYVFMAKLAEEAQRYDDMVEYVKKFAKMGVDATPEERNLLSIAYKNIIGTRRTAWRRLQSKSPSNYAQEYMLKIKKEVQDISNDLIDLLTNHLLPATKDPGSQVFYYKMKGDYYRYVAEITQENDVVNLALDAYKKGKELAEEHLKPTDPIRLGWALNFSVFYYEIMKSSEDAYKTAKKAFDDARVEFEKMEEDESTKDVAFILQLLRDNLSMWEEKEEEKDE